MRDNYTLARIYCPETLGVGASVDLPKDQVHYVSTVLRRSVGDILRVFNGRDGEWAASISALERKKCTLTITERLRAPKPCPDIWLCFAPVRKHRNAFILEKCTELGVSTFQPVITQHTQFPKIRLEKMQAQIIEAAEQTERLDIPGLAESVRLDVLLSNWPNDRKLVFADEGGDCAPAADVLKQCPEPAALLIGPEGGFSDLERAQIRAHPNVTAVSLGPRILRADTAAVAILTLWQSRVGDWQHG